MKLWMSLTITSFGAQITNLALPLAAAVMLQATPWQMGVLVALETLPFALVSLHAGVLIDRVRKLPIVIASTIGRGVALLAIPVAAYFGALSIELLFVVGFLCGIQNVVGGAAFQVLLAKMAGRSRLVEANAKVALGETSAALVGPGSRRRADPARHGAVRDPARCADVLRLGTDAAARSRPQRRAGTRPAALDRLRDPRGAAARLAQPDAARRSRGWRACGRSSTTCSSRCSSSSPRASSGFRRGASGSSTRSAVSAACSLPRWRSGSRRASAWARSSSTVSR